MTTIRAFIAIELPDWLRDRLAQLQDELEVEGPPGVMRWVRPEGIHLTLKFLGEVPLRQLPDIQVGLARAAATVTSFAFHAERLGCFPDTRRPNNVWVGVNEPTGALQRLQQAIEAQISPLGYPPENRPFHPHLTLGRASRHARPAELRQFGELIARKPLEPLGLVEVNGVSLMKSDLRPDGAIYTRLAYVPLSGAPQPSPTKGGRGT